LLAAYRLEEGTELVGWRVNAVSLVIRSNFNRESRWNSAEWTDYLSPHDFLFPKLTEPLRRRSLFSIR
jgi:hypothetical protein